MNTNPFDFAQTLLLTVIVGASCIHLLHRIAPTTSAALRRRLGAWLSTPERPAWQQRLGGRLAPKPDTNACGQCGGCAKPGDRRGTRDGSGHC